MPEDAAVDLVEEGRRFRVRSWSFALARYEMTVEDTGMTTALDGVLERTHAELVVNGGFFDPDGKAVGLAMSNGAVLSKLVKSLSGGVLVSDGSRASLFATEGFSLADAGVSFALQCRPRLVVDGEANVKSDDGKRAERTALCVRDEGRTVSAYVVRGSEDGESAGPSLFALAQHLTKDGCSAALNLDGGPSTGAAYREGERAVLLAPRSPVRHVVAFRERR
jgi:exopolysaccharide biosynthesis protein